MEQRLSPADRNDGRLQVGEPVDPAKHLIGWNRRGEIVEFVAITVQARLHLRVGMMWASSTCFVDSGPTSDHLDLAPA